jgi:hypothetical protein
VAGRLGSMSKKLPPRVLAEQVLAGRITLDAVDEVMRPLVQTHLNISEAQGVYGKKAEPWVKRILAGRTLEERKALIEKCPAILRPTVERMVKERWGTRNTSPSASEGRSRG